MKRKISELMPAIAVLACLAAWWALADTLPHCIRCHSAQVRHSPSREQPRSYECLSCGGEFVWVDDVPFDFYDAIDALSRPRELYAR